MPLAVDKLVNHLWRIKNVLDGRQKATNDETDGEQPDESQKSDEEVEDGHSNDSRFITLRS